LEIHAEKTQHSYATDEFAEWWESLEKAGLRAVRFEELVPLKNWTYPSLLVF
jgi:ABC-type thiamine transport system substrate-binding protein